MVISIIGGSGSGKDTQASLLSEKYDIPHLSMGAIMREQERLQNPLAIEAQKIANKGEWVPDEITSKLLLDYVLRNAPKGFILTGYPRFRQQCDSFKGILAELGLELTAVVHIAVPDDILIDRMKKQRDEASRSGDERSDTSDEIIMKRLVSYHETIKPVLEYYSTEGGLVEVDGTPAVEMVNANIVNNVEIIINN